MYNTDFVLHRMQISKPCDHDEFNFLLVKRDFLRWGTRWDVTAVVPLLFYHYFHYIFSGEALDVIKTNMTLYSVNITYKQLID